jgi:Homeodomain-like domain
VSDIQAGLARWELDLSHLREQLYRAPTPRERERGQARWLLAQGWSAAKVATLLERDAHTIGGWLTTFCQDGPEALSFEQAGGSPPPSGLRPKLA